MNNKTKNLVGIGLFTAIVVVLQALAILLRSVLPFFTISLVLVPIVVGAAVYGYKAGAWLGFVFGVVVLVSGDAATFLAINVPGTIFTVLAKGILSGYIAGLAYVKMRDKNASRALAVIVAAIICPIMNTGVFLLGCEIFFMDTINTWAQTAGFSSAGKFMIIGLVGINFLIEMGINVVLSPVIVRIIGIGKNKKAEGERISKEDLAEIKKEFENQ